MTQPTEHEKLMATAQERRKWALGMAAALLHSDMDCFGLDEYDEDEQNKRHDAIRKIADDLNRKAARINVKGSA